MFSHLIGQAEIKHRNTSYREGLIQIVRLDKYTAFGAFLYSSCQQLLFVLSLINILVSTGQESSRTRAHGRRRLLSGLPKEERGEACLHPGDAQQDDLGEGDMMVMKVMVIMVMMVRMVKIVNMVMMVMQCVQF